MTIGEDSINSRRPPAVGMFVYKDAAHDARVWREAQTLAESGRRVAIAALQPGNLPESEERGGAHLYRVRAPSASVPGNSPTGRALPIRRAQWLLGYIKGLITWRSRAVDQLQHVLRGSDVVWHGHDLTGALAADLARRRYGGRVIYDSHELFLDANAATWLPGLLSRGLMSVEAGILKNADAVVTVNDHIARELSNRYGVPRPAVVMNCPPLGSQPAPRLASPLRKALGLGDRPVILFHGLIVKERVATTVDALDYLPTDTALVLLGHDGTSGWVRDQMARRAGQGRLYWHPPVPMFELPQWVSGADVGIMAFLGTSLNQLFFTPNKLFECLNAGVPVVASDFPTMRDIVTPDVGKLCDPDQPTSIASAVSELLSESVDRRAWRRTQCRDLAERRYNWEIEAGVLLSVYSDLLAGRPVAF